MLLLLVSRHLASSPLTFFMIPSLPLCLYFLFRSCLLLRWSRWSPPQSAILESAMPRAPVLATTRGCGANFIAFHYNAWRKCAHTHTHTHIYIYIYIYIQTLPQNRTAVINISLIHRPRPVFRCLQYSRRIRFNRVTSSMYLPPPTPGILYCVLYCKPGWITESSPSVLCYHPYLFPCFLLICYPYISLHS